MNNTIDLVLVRTFAVVCEYGSMSAAARISNMTQGAVSQQVKRLEDDLCARLFERNSSGIRLTNAGELFLENAKRLLRLNDEIYAEMNARPVQGSVRIGIPHDLIATSMVPILKAFSEDFPDVDISIQCGSSLELLALVKSGGVDLALAEAPLKAATGECLVEERLVWVGARGGQAYRKKPLPVSLVSNTCAFHPVISQILRAGNRDWRTIHEGGSVEATAGAVLADLAVSAWLSASIPADLETLTKDDGLPDLPPFAIELHVARGKRHRAVDAMIRYIREGFGSRHALERIAQAS